VIAITDNLSASRNQTFAYDDLNRLISGSQSDGAFSQTFTYDPWGNATQAGTWTFQQPYASNNRLLNYPYDGAGDLLNDGFHNYTYDAEHRLQTVDGTAATYTYGPDGERVRKDTGGSFTEYVYFAGEPIAEKTASGWTDYIFAGGQRIAKAAGSTSASTQYYHADHLDTERMMTDASGTVISNCLYAPFGQQVSCSPDNVGNHYKFTGKERDAESGLDNFGARYMASTMARFMTPDPIHIMKEKLIDPQQWNGYAYVRNNPLRFTDPTGLYLVNCGSDDKKCNKSADKFEKQRQKDLKSKDIKVRNAAAAWGDRGVDNHVNVTFKPQAQVDADAGNTDTQHHRVDGIVSASPGADHKGQINAEFSERLGGSDLGQTIAHEGQHVEDDFNFLKSYDSSTGRYNPALNFTHFDTEFQAFEAGAGVKPYSMFPRGPKGYQQLEDYINTTYHDATDPVFPPSGVYPQ
jgi:RHS repeat-associated protein